MKETDYTVSSVITSVKHTINGFILFSKERNMRIQSSIGLMAVIGGIVLDISRGEWLAITICIGLVLALELVNSCLERVCDFITLERRDEIKAIKDMAGGAVLIVASASLVVAGIIFIPYLA